MVSIDAGYPGLTPWAMTCRPVGAEDGGSHQQLPDRLAPRDDPERPVEPVPQLRVGGDAEAGVDRRDDVRRRDRVAARPRADLVARPVDVPRLNPAAGEHQRVAEVPVVP